MMTAHARELQEIAQKMVTSGKGILAADESSGTIKKRFDSIDTPSSEQNRRDYREFLFRTQQAMKDHISGVILFDETLRQNAADGTPLAKIIADTGAICGIKVDTGAKDLAGSPGEKVTEGLDGLRERFAEYHRLGARFAKWRAVINITSSIPTQNCLNANAHSLARYAALAQEAGIVPIVEPEVIMDGDHDIDRCFVVTSAALKALFSALEEQNVLLEGVILKPNMVLSGTTCAVQASDEEIAEKTIQCFKENVPSALPGIVFLSGGQSDKEATARLNVMNTLENLPWKLSFSFGRALQAAPLKAWCGKQENVNAAQAAFAHRARMNGLAACGNWNSSLET